LRHRLALVVKERLALVVKFQDIDLLAQRNPHVAEGPVDIAEVALLIRRRCRSWLSDLKIPMGYRSEGRRVLHVWKMRDESGPERMTPESERDKV